MLPSVAERFPTLESFGRVTLPQLLEGLPADLPRLEAINLDSGILLNRGDHFEWRILPVAAQFSPVQGIAVADFDGDGSPDDFDGNGIADALETGESGTDGGRQRLSVRFYGIPGKLKRVLWNTADRLMAMIASQRSAGNASTAATCWMPALLTRMSTPPNSRSA